MGGSLRRLAFWKLFLPTLSSGLVGWSPESTHQAGSSPPHPHPRPEPPRLHPESEPELSSPGKGWVGAGAELSGRGGQRVEAGQVGRVGAVLPLAPAAL